MASESALSKDIRAALNSARGPDGKLLCRVVRNTVGVDTEKGIRYGLGNGSADLAGVLYTGVCFCVEVKKPEEKLRKDQRAWWLAARKWGIWGGRAESVDEALTLLERALPHVGSLPRPVKRGAGVRG